MGLSRDSTRQRIALPQDNDNDRQRSDRANADPRLGN